MTSFVIKVHENRPLPQQWASDTQCPFCCIIRKEAPSSVVYENDQVIAFLDIMPIRRGHTLVVPKSHIPRLSDLPAEVAAALGEAVSKVAQALTLALKNTALNVVCNQEYAQAIPHVHYHIIPAPKFDYTNKSTTGAEERTNLTYQEMHQKELEGRTDTDDEDAKLLVVQIRSRL